ncbi:DUF1810_domain-containing protein [Hexamita inflata]|uniref:DUF1810 domain-containing protein n=1 Tax=Hexamita inflata TaxID=28002 RepID=A0AA86NB35_9EUKA|nr:DUF1810 domain-containing protein [Hexamita inflata]
MFQVSHNIQQIIIDIKNELHTLDRFVVAQENKYKQVIRELKAGHKTSHWIWYIFPQLEQLGKTQKAKFYGIQNIEEAREYLQHPLLNQRLRECVQILNGLENKTAEFIFNGYPDDVKFHACMTLFSKAAEDNEVFVQALQKYFGGKEDKATLALLEAE